MKHGTEIESTIEPLLAGAVFKLSTEEAVLCDNLRSRALQNPRSRMICPSCSSEMSEENHRGVRLDVCSVCYGAWFDGGELEAFQASDDSTSLSGIPKTGARYEPTGRSAHVKCPRCEHDVLRTGRIAKHEVMRCTSCRGVFLPNANSRFKTSHNGILDSAVGILEEIVGALF